MSEFFRKPVGFAVLLLLLSTPSFAEDLVLEEVVVTAQHREQSLFEVPISVTVLDADFLQASHIRRIDDMVGFTPGLSGWEQGASTPIYAVRGISSNSWGIGGEASVGVFRDDAYIGRINSTGAAYMDVQRVEVLKGPQGTLFGRNASAGVINIITNQPDDKFGVDYRLGYGSWDSLDGELTVNAPLVDDKLFFRGTLFRHKDRGFDKNVLQGNRLGDRDTWAGRGSLKWQANEDLSVRLTLSAENTNTGGLGYKTTNPLLAAIGGVTTDPFDGEMASDIEVFDNNRSRDATLHVDWAINSDLTLRSITAWHYNRSPNLFDVDGSAVFAFNAAFDDRVSRTLSQEFRLLGQHGSVNWLAGVSAFREDVSADIRLNYNDFALVGATPVPPDALFPGSPGFFVCDATSTAILGPCNPDAVETSTNKGDYRSYAVYGDASWLINERLTLHGGLRYTLDDKKFRYDAPAASSVTAVLGRSPQNPSGNVLGYATQGEEKLSHDWRAWQPRLALDYAWSDQVMSFVSATKGYKAGGFDPSVSEELSVFEPETVWSYELGVKSRLWQQRLGLNATAYYYDYNDYQVQVVDNGLLRTVNAPKVKGKGLELEANLQPSDRWLFAVTGTLSRSRFEDFVADEGDLSGNTPILSPDKTASAIGQYTYPFVVGDASIRLEYLYESRQYFTIQNTEDEIQDAYGLFNLFLSFAHASQHWQLSLYAKNLLDEEYFVFNQDAGAGRVVQRAAPRFVGFEVRGSF